MHAKELRVCLQTGLFENCEEDGRQIFVPYIIGEKGDGKSTIVKELCAANNAYMIDIRLALEDVPDLKGFPFVDKVQVNGQTVSLTSFATPDWIPHGHRLQEILQSGTKRTVGPFAGKPFQWVVIFFDEMARAKLDVHQIIFRMVLDFQHGDITFDKCVRIVSADNPATKDYKGVNKLDAALANRFTTLSYSGPTLAEWSEYEAAHSDSMIIRFLTEQTSMFRKGNATPRTLSKIGRRVLKSSAKTNGAILFQLLCGMCGEEFAAAFLRYYESSYKAIKAKTIFEGTKKEFEKAVAQIKDWNASHGKQSDAIADTAMDMLEYMKEPYNYVNFNVSRFIEVLNAFPEDKTWMIVRMIADNRAEKYPEGYKKIHPIILQNADIRAIISTLSAKLGTL